MNIDFHVHCDSADPADWRNFAEVCKRNDTAACICSASQRGDHEPGFPENSVVLEAARSYPESFIPFAYVDLWDKKVNKDTVGELSRQGFRGLKFIDPYYAYDHDFYMLVYEAAEELQMPVLFHTGLLRPSRIHSETKHPALLNMHPVCLDRIARSFPGLKIVMAHLGTCLWRFEGAQLLKLHPNLYGDLAGSGNYKIRPETLTAHFAGDTGLENPDFKVWRKLVLGSDAYFSLPHLIDAAAATYENLLKQCGVPSDIQKQIMGETVENWIF